MRRAAAAFLVPALVALAVAAAGDDRTAERRDHLSVALWIKNIANEDCKTYGLGIDGFGYNYFVKALPRTFGAELTHYF
jgi:hypothetical protein